MAWAKLSPFLVRHFKIGGYLMRKSKLLFRTVILAIDFELDMSERHYPARRRLILLRSSTESA